MQVEAIGRNEQLSTLKPGQCFFFDSSSGMRLGILTRDGAQKAFLVLAKADDNRSPWIITGNLASNLVVIDDVRIRTDWTSLAFGAATDLGQITSSGGNFYMRAALRKMETVTINLASGILEDPPPVGPIFHYTRWSAGIVRDNKWLSLIEFPFVEV